MARGIKLILALVVVVAAMVFLAGRAGEQPQMKQQQPVDLDALPK
jgi:preprotein translocase subunit YajC